VFFNNTALSQIMTWNQFQNMTGTYPEGTLPKYYRYPWNPKNVPLSTDPTTGQLVNTFNPGMRAFALNPTANKLDTKSGLIEFYSQYHHDWFPDDKTERPDVPQAGPSWECRQTQPLATKYPLMVDSPHPRFRYHTQYAENAMLAEIPQNRMILSGATGAPYAYESLWINTQDAAARGINYGDLVRVFNDRGQILCAAYITERVQPGVVKSPDGGWYDPINPGDPTSLDKGGCMNYLTPMRYQSKYASSPTWSAYLCQVEKYNGPLPIPASVYQTIVAGGL